MLTHTRNPFQALAEGEQLGSPPRRSPPHSLGRLDAGHLKSWAWHQPRHGAPAWTLHPHPTPAELVSPAVTGGCFASSSPSGLSLGAKGDVSLGRPRSPVPGAGLADCRPRGRHHHRLCDARRASASREAPATRNRGSGVCVKGNARHASTLVLGSKLRLKCMQRKLHSVKCTTDANRLLYGLAVSQRSALQSR